MRGLLRKARKERMMRGNRLVLKSGKIQEMSAAQVEELIGREQYHLIKKRDAHPFFVELLVAHEGVSRGKILNGCLNGSARKFWSAERIQELVSKLSRGRVPVYLFHNSDNKPRQRVGEILSAYAGKIQGAVSALALGYIWDGQVKEKIKKGELDTCSLEAELVFEERKVERGVGAPGIYDWIVNAIEKVSGVALGSRGVAKPGFAGASVLAQVEEFESDLNVNSSELEQRLREKEQELADLKEELAGYKKERENAERRQRFKEILERNLRGRNLRREEERHLEDEVGERIELKDIGLEELEDAVKEEMDKELIRLAELKRAYQRAEGVKVALEKEKHKSGNPLIPGEE